MPAPIPTLSPITLAVLRNSLSDRLNGAQFWGSPEELNAYLFSALTGWQARARYWRQPVGFNTHPDGAGLPLSFYDLSDEIPQLAYTKKDSDVLSLIEYHLLEPQSGIPTSTVWTGTDMFQQDAFTDAITRRRDRFLLDTDSVVKRYSIPSITAGTPRVTLPASLIDIRRVSWVAEDGTQTILWRDDEFAANAYSPAWAQTLSLPTPIAYSVAVTQPYTLQLLPPPGDIGALEILAIVKGADLDPVTGVVLGIPNNYVGAITFGAMADLLSQDGPGHDEERAEYCEQRYQEDVDLCRAMPTVINGAINQISCEIDSVFGFDAYSVGWNNLPYGTPTVLGLASQTMLAVSSVPDPANPSSIGIDCVVNCPLPPDDATPITITADVAELIVDEGEHLAKFKSGGQEFNDSLRLHKNFTDQAALYRSMSGARAPYWEAMARSNRVELVGRRMWR